MIPVRLENPIKQRCVTGKRDPRSKGDWTDFETTSSMIVRKILLRSAKEKAYYYDHFSTGRFSRSRGMPYDFRVWTPS